MKLEITGQDTAGPEAAARQLFANLGVPKLEEETPAPARAAKVEPIVAFGVISTVLLALPPAIDALLNLTDRARRDTARNGVEDLKTALEAAGSDCVVTMEGGRVFILPKAATDEVVDAVLADLQKRSPHGGQEEDSAG